MSIRWAFVCGTPGVIRLWILGALTLGFLSSLGKGFLTAYWQSSSLEILERFWSVLAHLCSKHLGTVVSFRLGITFPSSFCFYFIFFYFTITKWRTLRSHPQCICKQICTSSFPFSLICNKKLLCNNRHSAVGQEALLYGKTLFVIATTTSKLADHSSPRASASTSVALHSSESTKAWLHCPLVFLTAGSYKGDIQLHLAVAGNLGNLSCAMTKS